MAPRLRRFLLLPLIVVVLGVLVVASSSFSSGRTAEAKCKPNRADNNVTYHDGWYRWPSSTPNGVSSYILNYSPWVNPNDSTSSIVSLNRPSPSPPNWASVGWIEWAYDVRSTITQYTTPGVYNSVYYPAQPLGQSTEYRVEYWGYFAFSVNGVFLGNAPATWVPNQARAWGEISTLANQMPGAYNNNYEWFSLTYLNHGGGWQPFWGINTNDDPTKFGLYVTDPYYQFRIWDKSCGG